MGLEEFSIEELQNEIERRNSNNRLNNQAGIFVAFSTTHPEVIIKTLNQKECQPLILNSSYIGWNYVGTYDKAPMVKLTDLEMKVVRDVIIAFAKSHKEDKTDGPDMVGE